MISPTRGRPVNKGQVEGSAEVIAVSEFAGAGPVFTEIGSSAGCCWFVTNDSAARP